MPVGRFFKRRLERRRSPRLDGEDLVAYYWTGAIPSPREVRQIGFHGAFILAPDRFYPGTLVQIVLEDRATNGQDGDSHPNICIYAKALRRTADGFCVAFLFGDAAERKRFRRFLNHVKRKVVEEPQPEEAEPQSEQADSPAEVECPPGAEENDEAKSPDAVEASPAAVARTGTD